MASSYAKIADKLSKKLGEYEGILEGKPGSSVEPSDINAAKLKIPQIKQALQELEESQKVEVKVKELVEQGVPKDEARMIVMQQMQEEQMQMQKQQQDMQMAMEQQQASQQEGQSQPQGMPMDQGMSPYKSGGSLPMYQRLSDRIRPGSRNITATGDAKVGQNFGMLEYGTLQGNIPQVNQPSLADLPMYNPAVENVSTVPNMFVGYKKGGNLPKYQSSADFIDYSDYGTFFPSKIEGLGEADLSELNHSLAEAKRLGMEDVVAEIQTEIDRKTGGQYLTATGKNYTRTGDPAADFARENAFSGTQEEIEDWMKRTNYNQSKYANSPTVASTQKGMQQSILNQPFQQSRLSPTYNPGFSGINYTPTTNEELGAKIAPSSGTTDTPPPKTTNWGAIAAAAPAVLGGIASLINKPKPAAENPYKDFNPYAGMWNSQVAQANQAKPKPTGMDIPTAQSLGFTQSYPSLYAQKGGDLPRYQLNDTYVPRSGEDFSNLVGSRKTANDFHRALVDKYGQRDLETTSGYSPEEAAVLPGYGDYTQAMQYLQDMNPKQDTTSFGIKEGNVPIGNQYIGKQHFNYRGLEYPYVSPTKLISTKKGGKLPRYQQSPQEIENTVSQLALPRLEKDVNSGDMSQHTYNLYRDTLDKISDLPVELTTDPLFTQTLSKLEKSPDKYMDMVKETVPPGGINLGNFTDSIGNIRKIRKELDLSKTDIRDLMEKGGVGWLTRNAISSVLKEGGNLPMYQRATSPISEQQRLENALSGTLPGSLHPSVTGITSYPETPIASGKADYMPLEALALPGTPLIKGAGKVANIALDVANPLAGMGKNFVKEGLRDLQPSMERLANVSHIVPPASSRKDHIYDFLSPKRKKYAMDELKAGRRPNLTPEEIDLWRKGKIDTNTEIINKAISEAPKSSHVKVWDPTQKSYINRQNIPGQGSRETYIKFPDIVQHQQLLHSINPSFVPPITKLIKNPQGKLLAAEMKKVPGKSFVEIEDYFPNLKTAQDKKRFSNYLSAGDSKMIPGNKATNPGFDIRKLLTEDQYVDFIRNMQKIHKRGEGHFDLHKGNIMWSPNDRISIIDPRGFTSASMTDKIMEGLIDQERKYLRRYAPTERIKNIYKEGGKLPYYQAEDKKIEPYPEFTMDDLRGTEMLSGLDEPGQYQIDFVNYINTGIGGEKLGQGLKKAEAMREQYLKKKTEAFNKMDHGAMAPGWLPPKQASDTEIPWGDISRGVLGAVATAPIFHNIKQSKEPIDYYEGFVNPYIGQMQASLGDMERLTKQAEEGLNTPRFYDPRHELVKARQRYNTAMQNASDASGGSARFALQNRAQGQLGSDTDQILTKAQNINAQWNDPRARAQGLMGLAGAYGQQGRMGYGLGQDIGAERYRVWDLAQRAEAARRAHGTQAAMDTSEWAQTQQAILNQKEMDKLTVEQMSYLLDNFEWKDGGWKPKKQ